MKKIIFLFIIISFYSSLIISQNLKFNFPEKEQSKKTSSLQKGFDNKEKFNSLQLKNVKLLPDSLVRNLVQAINADSIKMYITGLQNMGTRYAYSRNKDRVINWIKQKYLNMGFTDVALDTFYTDGFLQTNIVATLPGKNKNEVCIIGGHYDSISNDSNYDSLAPGADDNASGASIALELARVLMQKKYVPECTIKFINFDTEELGLYGSEFFAKNFYKTGLNLKLMINADMISYSKRFPDSANVAINYYKQSEYWSHLSKQMFLWYTKLNAIDGEQNSEYSDSYSFWKNGYQTVYFSEDEFSPYYHSKKDTVGNYNMPYCAEIMKGACALLINACQMPGPVQNFTLSDVGDGKSVLATWKKATSSDFISYKVYVGYEANKYDSTFTTADTVLTIQPNLKSNTVFIAVSVLSKSGIESSLSEKSTLITSSPFAPNIFVRDINKHDIEFYLYNYNKPVLFAGNNVYRADSLNGEYVKINSAFILDSVYIDKTAKPGRYYYYRAKTFYSSGAESEYSNVEKARLATLDRGIGIFITAKDGDGNIDNPSLQQLQDFFAQSLSGFSATLQKLDNSSVTISDIGAYSSVVWYNMGDYDSHTLFYSKEIIEKYLKLGGKLILSSTYPTIKFDYNEFYPDKYEYNQGNFVFDYFKIGSRYYNSLNTPFFKGAAATAAGYSSLQVDTAKILPAYNGQLADIETFAPNSLGKTIYSFTSIDDSCSLNGHGVGVEYMGNDYKTILLSFPLYYMKADQVKKFFQYVFTNKFSEPLAVNKNKAHLPPSDFSLKQNYPNPFNPATNINFELPVSSKIKLVVYNSLGQQVDVLYDNIKPAGRHSMQFNAGRLASGVYFYSLIAQPLISGRNTYHASGKMLLIK